MRGARIPFAQQKAEIARLDAIGRTRALTRDESDRLANLLYRDQLRGYRRHHADRDRQLRVASRASA